MAALRRLSGVLLAVALAQPAAGLAQSPPAAPDGSEVLTVEKAVAWALLHNPDLAVTRKQRGIAEANVVIARTYPFNPVWQPTVMGIGGPADAGITNRVFVQNVLQLELELHGQGKIRRAAADAGLSRTEWEIGAQELAIGVRAIRAFNGFVYRQGKLKLLDDTIKLQEETVKDVKRLFDQGKLKPADPMLATADLVEAKGLRGSSQALMVAAWNDLRRVMGIDVEVAGFRGRLELEPTEGEIKCLTETALQTRPDLRALELAVAEADQRVRLEIANRFGNVTIGPKLEYNETRVFFLGPTASIPLPVLNAKRGAILLREAERDRAMEDRRRLEIQTTLDVKAALARIGEAEKWVAYFKTESLPALQKTMESFEKLFALGEPSVDVARLIDARRRLLRARDGYLDALWELSQARTDLAAAVGDLHVALPIPSPPPPAVPPAVQPASGNLPRPALLPPVPQRE
jgi:outer membrane protein TolC